MPLPTPPSSISISAQAGTSITLAWTAGAGDHYDVYRAPIRRSGYFGPFAKVNAAAVAIAATGFVDAGAASLSPPTANQHYCYVVYAVAADSSQLAGQPVFATSFDGTDATELIYNAMLSRVASVLTGQNSTWSEIERVVELRENSSNSRDYRYGLLVGSGAPVAGPVGSYDTAKKFRILLVRDVAQADNNDNDLRDKIKGNLSQMMEMCYVDLLRSRLGLPGVVVQVQRPDTADPEFRQEENTVVLAGEVVVHYRIDLA